MQLSIIIVNYNVKYFLEQCLHSVEKAIARLDAEVWVVDNASSDESIEYLQPRFPYINYIKNKQNLGYAKANNQALVQCKGAYVLFLNPDTIIPEDCLQKCLGFLQANTQAAALGVRMLDGSGKFLPESKRSFPHPFTSFYKLVGLSRLFPKSKIFSRYALGYLSEFHNHEVDVLAGAFMLVKGEALRKLNGFDETFFMYGEDIDLSYRIQQSGSKNYYFSEASIIHFKGESTRKGSLNYMKMFYQAMSIFVQKHYSGGKASVFRFLIQTAIFIRAIFSAFLKFIVKIGMPLLDALLIFASFEGINLIWIEFIREGEGFVTGLVDVSLPGYTLLFLAAATFAGIYDSRYKPSRAFYSAVVATIIMLAVYSLLPERFRFSRGIILCGSLTAVLLMTLVRWLLLKWGVVEDVDETRKHHQTVIVASEVEFKEVKELLTRSGLKERIMGRVSANGSSDGALGTVSQLITLVENVRVKEVIFCVGYLSYSAIITLVQQMPKNVSIRFHACGSQSIVGSDSKDTSGEYVSAEGNFQLSQPYQKRMKKLVDVCLSLFILLTFPVHIILTGFRSLQNACMVLAGRRTWIGYTLVNKTLPSLRPGVLSTAGLPLHQREHNAGIINMIDHWYAKNYNWRQDVKIIIKNYRRLGERELR